MQCPFCNEEIKDGAKKCKHCWEFLDWSKKESAKEEKVVYVEQTKKKKMWCIGWAVSIFIILLIIWYIWNNSAEKRVNWWWSSADKTPIVHYIWWDDIRWSVENWIWIYPWEIQEETTLKSNNMFEWNLVAWSMSKYLIVSFQVQNEQGAEATLRTNMFPKIYDSQWRSYSQIDCWMSCSFYVKNRPAMLTSKPWIPLLVQLVYEVPRDSEWYYFKYNI